MVQTGSIPIPTPTATEAQRREPANTRIQRSAVAPADAQRWHAIDVEDFARRGVVPREPPVSETRGGARLVEESDTMDRESRDRVAAWIRAEQDGSPDDRDRAFEAVAGGWGHLQVPDGLAARVAAAATPSALGSGLWTSWWTRAGVAASLAAAGSMLAFLPSGALGVMALGSVQMVAAGVDRTLWAARAWVATVGAIAHPVAGAATVLGGVLLAPAPLCVMAVNVAVAGAALAALRRVLAAREV